MSTHAEAVEAELASRSAYVARLKREGLARRRRQRKNRQLDWICDPDTPQIFYHTERFGDGEQERQAMYDKISEINR